MSALTLPIAVAGLSLLALIFSGISIFGRKTGHVPWRSRMIQKEEAPRLFRIVLTAHGAVAIGSFALAAYFTYCWLRL